MDHVALLTSSIQRAVRALGLPEAPPDQIESFADEGTRELYVGPSGQPGRLLLIEPLEAGRGPYGRALAARGAGLHHLAIRVGELTAGVLACGERGWLLHPRSVLTMPAHDTAWMCRPGFPALLEVMAGSAPATGRAVVQGVRVPVACGASDRLLEVFPAATVRYADQDHVSLQLGGRSVGLGDLP